MKKLSHVPCFSTSTAKPKSYRDKSQMFLRSRSVPCVLSHVVVDAVADPIPRILLVPNVVLIWNFLATNDKGYDNSRLSDNIHRGSRQIHDKWFTQYFSHEQYSIQNEKGCLPVLPFLSVPLIVKTYVICLLAARKHLLFGISSKVGILPWVMRVTSLWARGIFEIIRPCTHHALGPRPSHNAGQILSIYERAK